MGFPWGGHLSNVVDMPALTGGYNYTFEVTLPTSSLDPISRLDIGTHYCTIQYALTPAIPQPFLEFIAQSGQTIVRLKLPLPGNGTVASPSSGCLADFFGACQSAARRILNRADADAAVWVDRTPDTSLQNLGISALQGLGKTLSDIGSNLGQVPENPPKLPGLGDVGAFIPLIGLVAVAFMIRSRR